MTILLPVGERVEIRLGGSDKVQVIREELYLSIMNNDKEIYRCEYPKLEPNPESEPDKNEPDKFDTW